MTQAPRVAVLAGGFGGARMSHGMALAASARAEQGRPGLDLSIVVNTGDDLVLHGLNISPDLDTVMYTLAGLANEETGWGVRDETWSTARMLARYGAPTWFALGDQDLATHLVRTQGLRGGLRLTEVTARLCERLGVAAQLLPMSDDPVRTEVRTADGWLEFQDYFVRRGQRDEVLEIRHRGADAARPTPEAVKAIRDADLIVLAPSNPFVSIGTILAVPGMLDTMLAASAPVVAVSPIVGGRALRGPADRMLASMGGSASARGLIEHYEGTWPGLVDTFVVDTVDRDLVADLEAAGRVAVTGTVMPGRDERRRLAEEIVRIGLGGRLGA